MPGGSLKQEAGERLTALTPVPIVVVADQYLAHRQGRKQRSVDRLHHVLPLCPARDVGLVRDPD